MILKRENILFDAEDLLTEDEWVTIDKESHEIGLFH